MSTRRLVPISFIVALLLAAVLTAQSPNTGSIIVTVLDQNDAVIQGASIKVINSATAEERDAVSGADGSATFAGLALNGEYKVVVDRAGFAANEAGGLQLRAGETAQVKIKLAVSGATNEVTVIGTAQGVRADPQIGLLVNSKEIDRTPILGRKFSAVPLLNSAFRSGKGTGDLFVNQVYFITGVGSRRATTFLLDGASNDEGWGRQVGVATVPIGAVQEVNVMTNAFSSEFGWTSGPALNIVTKSGTNAFHGEGLVMFRPGSWQAERFSTDGFCPSSVATCTVPSALAGISPVDIPDKLAQFEGAVGGPIIQDRTFFFVTAERTHQDRTTFLSPSLPAFVLPADGDLEWTGHYRQTIVDARLDHHLNSKQTLMGRFNFDQFYDDNPQDAVGGSNAPSVARRYSRQSWTTQVNHTAILNAALLNEFRFAFLNGDPVTKWEAAELSTIYSRGSGNGAVPFTVGQSRQSDLFSRQVQFADTLSWTKGKHYVRFGGSVIHHQSGGTGNEPGALTLGTFTFYTTYPNPANNPRNRLPLDQLNLTTDVQQYSQPINYGVTSYDLGQWLLTGFVQDKWRAGRHLTLDIGLRYDRQTLTDAKADFQPRLGFAWNPAGDARTVIRAGYAMYYTQIRTNALAGYLINGLDGIATYTATLGQTGFPTCLVGSCLPVNVDPRTLPASQLPARDITIVAGKRSFYEEQFARYGLNFSAIASNYPDKLVNPRSQVFTAGVEHEFFDGLFVGSDFVHQRFTNADRTIDLNAPAPFPRTAPGQTRSVANANATRPILPANGGVRQINTFMNLGEAEYNGLQNQISYRGNHKFFASLSYTLSKATNTNEPDGNGIGPNESHISTLYEQERGPSVVDQRHRAVFHASYEFPWHFTAGALVMLASARPFNATTGVDNNGDGIQNDRPVINGVVIPKSAFRGRATQDVGAYLQERITLSEHVSMTLRLEGFNILNHTNMLARGVTVYGNGVNANPDFGRFASVTNTDTLAIPAFANIDPPRMFQILARFVF